MSIPAQLVNLLRTRDELRSTNIIYLPRGEQSVLLRLLKRTESRISDIVSS